MLYFLVHYAIAGTVTTDAVLLYFSITLFVTSSLGYIPFTQYFVLSVILVVEYNLFSIFRSMEFITHGSIDDETQICMDECLAVLDFHVQLEGNIPRMELVFGNICVIVVSFLVGYNVYIKEKKHKYSYLETLCTLSTAANLENKQWETDEIDGNKIEERIKVTMDADDDSDSGISEIVIFFH